GIAAFTGGVSALRNVVGTPGNDHITARSLGSTITANGGTDVLQGGAGIDVFLIAAGQNAATTVDGGGGSNTLIGPNATNTWNVTGANAGTLNGVGFSN